MDDFEKLLAQNNGMMDPLHYGQNTIEKGMGNGEVTRGEGGKIDLDKCTVKLYPSSEHGLMHRPDGFARAVSAYGAWIEFRVNEDGILELAVAPDNNKLDPRVKDLPFANPEMTKEQLLDSYNKIFRVLVLNLVSADSMTATNFTYNKGIVNTPSAASGVVGVHDRVTLDDKIASNRYNFEDKVPEEWLELME